MMQQTVTPEKRYKNRIKPDSGAPSAAAILLVLALGGLSATYWPVFAKAFSGGGGTDPVAQLLAVVYGVLLAGVLLFAIFTGALGKKTMIPAALCAVPVFLYYFIEKAGVLEFIVFYPDKDLFFVYENNPVYFSGQNLLWIMLGAFASLFSMIAFLLLCFQKKKGRMFQKTVIVVAFAIRLYAGCYHLIHNEFVLYNSGVYKLADIFYAVLGQVCGALFFLAVVVLTFAMRKTEISLPSEKETGTPELSETQSTDETVLSPADPAQTQSREVSGSRTEEAEQESEQAVDAALQPQKDVAFPEQQEAAEMNGSAETETADNDTQIETSQENEAETAAPDSEKEQEQEKAAVQ